MSRAEKLLDRIVNNPSNVRFEDLCSCAKQQGFTHVRTKGSHEIYRHPGPPGPEMLDLQPGPDGKAKPYQVKQFLQAIERLSNE